MADCETEIEGVAIPLLIGHTLTNAYVRLVQPAGAAPRGVNKQTAGDVVSPTKKMGGLECVSKD